MQRGVAGRAWIFPCLRRGSSEVGWRRQNGSQSTTCFEGKPVILLELLPDHSSRFWFKSLSDQVSSTGVAFWARINPAKRCFFSGSSQLRLSFLPRFRLEKQGKSALNFPKAELKMTSTPSTRHLINPPPPSGTQLSMNSRSHSTAPCHGCVQPGAQE